MKRQAAPRVEVRVARRFRTPPERVYDSWIDPGIAGRWLFATASRPAQHVRIDARIGGSFRFVANRRRSEVPGSGRYLEIARPWRLAFTLTRGAWSGSRVRVKIVPSGPGCELTLVHENVPPDDAAQVEGRWTGMLYGLGTLLGRNGDEDGGEAPPRRAKAGDRRQERRA